VVALVFQALTVLGLKKPDPPKNRAEA